LLAKHGVGLRTRVLHDEDRVLIHPWQPRRLGSALLRLHDVLDQLEDKLQAA
jgi:hypothetical protein